MHEINNDRVFMVVYECGASVIHEYMSESDYKVLESKELNQTSLTQLSSAPPRLYSR